MAGERQWVKGTAGERDGRQEVAGLVPQMGGMRTREGRHVGG